jgi:hypothetical protein
MAVFSQDIVIGTGTDLTDGTGSDPIDGYYNSFRYQVVYTAAELSASLTPYDEITGLGFSVSEDYGGGDLLGYTIKMGHTSAVDAATHIVDPTIVVRNAADYDPTVTAAGVFDMLLFDTNFVWNGVDNVVVDICTDGQNPYTAPRGGVRTTSIVTGSRFYRTDGGTSCGNNTTGTNGNKPNIQFNYIDGTPPACVGPNALTVANIMPTSADLGWTTGGSGESNWDVEVLPVATAATGTPTDTGVANPFNKTGLTANTAYKFYVRANCGGGASTWSGPFNFTTSCAAINVPFTETFNSASTTQNCWSVLNNNNDGDQWDMDYTTNPQEGDEVAVIYTDYNAGNNDDYLISPGIILTGNERLKYQYRVQSAGEPDDFEVLLSTTGTAPADFTNTLVASASYSNTGYMEQVVDLSAYTGTVYVAWHVPNGGPDGWRLYIDTVVFEAIPSCVEPNTLTAANIMATSADLAWTSGGSGEATWDVEVLATGVAATGTPTDTGVANPFNKTGLTATTTYDYYVRANCGGGDSVWVGPFTFTTLCATINPTYINDFTAYPGNCWEEGNDTDIATGPNNTDGAWGVDGFLNVGTTGAARINLYNTGDMDWIVSPTFDLSAGSFGLAFDVGVTAYANTTASAMDVDDEVQVLISDDNGATWINLETFNAGNTPSNTGDAKLYDLAAYTSATTKFAFWASEGATGGTEDFDFFIDNFKVDLHAALGVEELKEIEGFVMYPNPVKNKLTVSAKNEIKKLSVVNMLGQVIKTVTPNSRDYKLDFSDLTSGIYFVKASVNNTEGTFRIVKN